MQQIAVGTEVLISNNGVKCSLSSDVVLTGLIFWNRGSCEHFLKNFLE